MEIGYPHVGADLDRLDQELAEVRGHVDYLEALVARDMRWGNPTKRSRDLWPRRLRGFGR